MPLASGGTALVTGATSGIGRFIALGLARAGLDVIVSGRDPVRLDEVRTWIRREVPAAAVETVAADLASLTQVRRLAREVGQRTASLAVLVNNAGLFRKRRELSVDGHELILAVNYLAPFVLTGELLPLLEASPRARIVNVGSSASDAATLDLDDLESERRPGLFGMVRAYAQSKLALMMATFELARRLDPGHVTANVVHPGLVATTIAERGGIVGLSWRLAKPFMIGPERGAETPLHVAIAPGLGRETGRYFKNKRPVAPNPLALDQALAQRLWERTQRIVDAAATNTGTNTATARARPAPRTP